MSLSGAEIYRLIETRAQELGFADFGCAHAGELPNCMQQHYMEALANGHFANMEYLGRNLDKRFNPQLLVEGARSVMVFQQACLSSPSTIVAESGRIAQEKCGCYNRMY
jgi:epoxyqueuosine reductase QueG